MTQIIPSFCHFPIPILLLFIATSFLLFACRDASPLLYPPSDLVSVSISPNSDAPHGDTAHLVRIRISETVSAGSRKLLSPSSSEDKRNNAKSEEQVSEPAAGTNAPNVSSDSTIKAADKQTNASSETKNSSTLTLADTDTKTTQTSGSVLEKPRVLNVTQVDKSKSTDVSVTNPSDMTTSHEFKEDGDEMDDESYDNLFGENDQKSVSGMIAEARAQRGKYVNGGFVELIEWLFVFILVAPGTFPAIGCILLTCTSFWRRRMASVTDVAETSRGLAGSAVRVISGNTTAGYQHVSHGDHGVLVSRPRKGAGDERDADI